MRKNWPHFIVASLLNTVLITGAFIEFKVRGMAAPQLPAAPQPAWYQVNPFAFGGCIFIISFLLITAVIGIKEPVGGINKKLHSFNESLANQNQLAIDNGQ